VCVFCQNPYRPRNAVEAMGVTSKPSFRALRQRVIPLRASQGGFEKLPPVAAFRRDPRRYRVSARSSKNFGIFFASPKELPVSLTSEGFNKGRECTERQERRDCLRNACAAGRIQ
jgi:hypothetical protein